MARYRVEAQELVVREIEAETEAQACDKMDELLKNMEYDYFNWSISAYADCNGCNNYKKDEKWCYFFNGQRNMRCSKYET